MKKITILAAIVLLFSGCAIQRALNMVNLQYQMGDIVNINWAGINLSKVKSVNDLSVADAAKAAAAIARKDFTITCNMNVIARNKTSQPAALGGFDYELQLDGKKLIDGSNPKINLSIPPNGTQQIIPIPMRIDIREVLQAETLESFLNLVGQLTNYGIGNPSKVALKFRPYVKVADTNIKMSYITLNKTFQ
ncbi:MAG TPA: hypothetical protein P5134_02665 [Bacteroidales bacterium]|nr:hypothetical protein [Bacteroidales bacterium]